jgi:hypothetical protein
MVAQPPHEPARQGGEATLAQTDEADDVAVRGLGFPSDAGGTIHAGYGPLPVGVNWPPFTSSFSASGVTIDRGHGKGSSIRIGGAMEDKDGKKGWRRKRKEREQIRSGEPHGREEDELHGGWMRMTR